METEASINDLRRAVEGLDACTASHREAVQVHEDFKGHTVWDGVIHVFHLEGHRNARLAYAWSSPVEGSDRRKVYAVLHIPPVDSSEAAVRAAIVADHRSER